jgi:hypothetical protein
MKLVVLIASVVLCGCSSRRLDSEELERVCDGVAVDGAAPFERGARASVIAFERSKIATRVVEGDAATAQVVVCVDVLDKVKVRDCEYAGGSRASLWNARLRLRAIEAHTGLELARDMREVEHDTSNVVSQGCPMSLASGEPTEKLPSYKASIDALLSPLVGVATRKESTGTLDHLVGVRTRQAHP